MDDARVVAVIGSVYALFWAGTDSVAEIVARHGLKVGDKLVPLSLLAEAEHEAKRWEALADQWNLQAIDNAKQRDALQSRLEQEQASLQFVQAKLDALAGLADRWVNDPKYSLDQCANDLLAALGGESLQRFNSLLDAPLENNAAISRLLATPAPWDECNEEVAK